jgi:hypothetical protein
VQNAELIIPQFQDDRLKFARCSACDQTFPLTDAALVDAMVGQRELRHAFDKHVREKHTWRADANQTAALRLRKAMEDFEQ